MKLENRQWINYLSKQLPDSKESIIIITKFGNALKLKKGLLQKYFSKFPGIGFKKGREIKLVSNSKGNSNYPSWIIEYLSLNPGDLICVTERAGIYYLKKLNLEEIQTEIPAPGIIDHFEDTVVTRYYAIQPDLKKITHSRLKNLCMEAGKFRRNPIVPLLELKNRIGLLARKEFEGGWPKKDKELIKTLKNRVLEGQLDNGNWENSAALTAFKLIRLAEVGINKKDAHIRKAIRWLLSAKEPLGFPGLHMISEDSAESFNKWKRAHKGRDRGPRAYSKSQQQLFVNNSDIIGVSNSFCEVKILWTVCIVLEALLRHGMIAEARTKRIINTLLYMREEMRWCGCGNFVASLKFPDSTAKVDFNKIPVRLANPKGNGIWLINLPSSEKDILQIVSDNPDYGHFDFHSRSIGKNKALVLKKPDAGSGDCSFIAHRALSWHPDYHESNLETMGALEMEFRQGWDGSWTGNSLSFIFSTLERMDCPFSAFLVLRSIPHLIHVQAPDGLWHEDKVYRLGGGWKAKPFPALSAEEISFFIIKALNKFGFLKDLLPKGK